MNLVEPNGGWTWGDLQSLEDWQADHRESRSQAGAGRGVNSRMPQRAVDVR